MLLIRSTLRVLLQPSTGITALPYVYICTHIYIYVCVPSLPLKPVGALKADVSSLVGAQGTMVLFLSLSRC